MSTSISSMPFSSSTPSISSSLPLGAGAAAFLVSTPNLGTSAGAMGRRRESSEVGSSGLELGQSAITTPGGKIEKAATEFEALLIGQILKSARESGEGGWMGTDSGDADSSVVELAEQQLASALSSQGGLGLGKLIQQGLKQSEKDETASPTLD